MFKNILKLHLPSAESAIKYFNVIQKNISIVANLKKLCLVLALLHASTSVDLCLKKWAKNIMNPFVKKIHKEISSAFSARRHFRINFPMINILH